jgi:hypothetical protein
MKLVIPRQGSAPQTRLKQLFTNIESGETLISGSPNVILVERVLADGSRVLLPRLVHPLDVYLVTEDRVEGPIKTHVYITRGRFILLNDALLSKLRIVILDPFEGIWCFKDETGKKERRGA